MKKFFFISLILSLIFFTAFIKNSTKRIDDEIYIIKENIRVLKKDKEKIKLEHDYLSSTEKLMNSINYILIMSLLKKILKKSKLFTKNSIRLKLNN